MKCTIFIGLLVVGESVAMDRALLLTDSPKLTDSPSSRRRKKVKKNRLACEKLVKACTQGEEETVKVLLEEVSELDQLDGNGKAPNHYAAQAGHLACIKLLVDKKADFQLKENTYDWTPLYLAAEEGHYDLCDYLIGLRADVEVKDRGGWRPLHIAARKGHEEICTLLLKSGADKEARSETGFTPLLVAAAHGMKESVQFFIGRGAQIDVTDKEGMAALHFAAMDGESDLSSVLIEADAEIELKDAAGNTPLHVAVLHRQREVCKVLVDAGASCYEENNEFKTPLEFADVAGDPVFRYWVRDLFDEDQTMTIGDRLIEAINEQDSERVEYYLSDESLQKLELHKGLKAALKIGNLRIVGMLIGNGALTIEELRLYMFSRNLEYGKGTHD